LWDVVIDHLVKRRDLDILYVHTTDYPMHMHFETSAESQRHLTTLDTKLAEAAATGRDDDVSCTPRRSHAGRDRFEIHHASNPRPCVRSSHPWPSKRVNNARSRNVITKFCTVSQTILYATPLSTCPYHAHRVTLTTCRRARYASSVAL
jgi:hypothetical protein